MSASTPPISSVSPACHPPRWRRQVTATGWGQRGWSPCWSPCGDSWVTAVPPPICGSWAPAPCTDGAEVGWGGGAWGLGGGQCSRGPVPAPVPPPGPAVAPRCPSISGTTSSPGDLVTCNPPTPPPEPCMHPWVKEWGGARRSGGARLGGARQAQGIRPSWWEGNQSEKDTSPGVTARCGGAQRCGHATLQPPSSAPPQPPPSPRAPLPGQCRMLSRNGGDGGRRGGGWVQEAKQGGCRPGPPTPAVCDGGQAGPGGGLCSFLEGGARRSKASNGPSGSGVGGHGGSHGWWRVPPPSSSSGDTVGAPRAQE